MLYFPEPRGHELEYIEVGLTTDNLSVNGSLNSFENPFEINLTQIQETGHENRKEKFPIPFLDLKYLTLLLGFRFKIANFFTTPLSRNSQKRIEHKNYQTAAESCYIERGLFHNFKIAMATFGASYTYVPGWRRSLENLNTRKSTLRWILTGMLSKNSDTCEL